MMSEEKEEKRDMYIDMHNSVTASEFFKFLEEKGVTSKCSSCGKNSMSGVLAVGENQALTLTSMNKEMSKVVAHECVGLTCILCGHVDIFWVNIIRNWKESQKNKAKE
ncbi:hypothetical protein ACK1M2_001686 [Providencia rettgeri]